LDRATFLGMTKTSRIDNEHQFVVTIAPRYLIILREVSMAKKRKTVKVSEKAVKKAAKPVVTKRLGAGTIRVFFNDRLESQPIAAGDNAAELSDTRVEASSGRLPPGAGPSIQYQILVQNTSSDWTIVGWSYSPDQNQIWKALKAGWVYPFETGLVLTRENYEPFTIYFIARINPNNPTDPVCYSPVIDVAPDSSYPGSTIPWSGCKN
jgi:hypothetical protein